MVHVIYSYFIVAALFTGYATGDQFDNRERFYKWVAGIAWLPLILWGSLQWLWEKALKYDPVCFALIRLFSYNPFKGMEPEYLEQAFAVLQDKFVPKWEKTRVGRHCIKGFEKLKKLNGYVDKTQH